MPGSSETPPWVSPDPDVGLARPMAWVPPDSGVGLAKPGLEAGSFWSFSLWADLLFCLTLIFCN